MIEIPGSRSLIRIPLEMNICLLQTGYDRNGLFSHCMENYPKDRKNPYRTRI
jgi:hypothetical protein